MKKVLVIGGTGAIGRHTVKELLNEGYKVDVLSLDDLTSDNPNLKYMTGPGNDKKFVGDLLIKEKYDGIIDYMTYTTAMFAERFEMFLENTKHYIFLSSYRVYDEAEIITENSPRLLDVSEDEEFLKTEDYALYKARCENILRASKYKNWTITRPSITYSERRYQLITWEAPVLIPRALSGKKVVVPKDAFNINTSMTYAGDSGKMFAKLMFNERAYGETFTISTSEFHPWSYVADCYTKLIGAEFEWVDTETYYKIRGGGTKRFYDVYQLTYDRLFNRVIDNSKILDVTGLKQEDFMPLEQGLKTVLSAVDLSKVNWNIDEKIFKTMDSFLEGKEI